MIENAPYLSLFKKNDTWKAEDTVNKETRQMSYTKDITNKFQLDDLARRHMEATITIGIMTWCKIKSLIVHHS